MTALRVGDLRIAENESWYLLVQSSGHGPPIRRFSKKVWTIHEVRAWRDGYVWGRDHQGTP